MVFRRSCLTLSPVMAKIFHLAALLCFTRGALAEQEALRCDFSNSCELSSDTNAQSALVSWEPSVSIDISEAQLNNNSNCEKWTSDKIALETPCGSLLMFSRNKDDRYMTAKKSGNSTEAWLVSPTFKSTAKIQLDYFLKDPSAALSICKRVESQASAVLECVGKATEGDKQQWRKIHVEIPASSKAYQIVIKAEVPNSNSIVAIDNVVVTTEQPEAKPIQTKPDFSFLTDEDSILKLFQLDPSFFLPSDSPEVAEKSTSECPQVTCNFANNTCEWGAYTNASFSTWNWATGRKSVRKIGTREDADGGVGLMYAALEKNDTFSTGYAISSPRFKLDSPAILKFKYFYRGHGGYLDVCEDSVSICMIRLQNVELIKHQMADWRDAQLILHPGVHKIVLVARDLDHFGMGVDNLQLLSADLSQPAQCSEA